ncbi:MAG: RNA methyltransferase [Bdellovibrionaceae bacterium]|nr:RNA methyltransferase [Pseudobdellovibrionaceae bacterium]
MKTVTCPTEAVCAGCDYLGLTLDAQLSLKKAELAALLSSQSVTFPNISVWSPGTHGLRDRLDFTLEEGRFGLRHKQESRIVDLEECPQLSPALHDWFLEFRQRLPALRKGSIRLRVSPEGQRGLWLDLANIDIKNLMDETTWLNSWSDDVIIEMGQRRKFLRRSANTRPELVDPLFLPWFETRWRDHKVPLYGQVGSFTQPSLVANRWIGEWIQESVEHAKPRRITELGAGQGNLSFPALSGEAHLTVCESDRPALAGFEKTLEVLATEQGIDLRDRVTMEAGDFLRKSSESLLQADLLIANPPRSGLKAFLEPLSGAQNLSQILYMSCHPESFSEDAPRLQKEGFHLQTLTLLDQFPQTKHYEVLSHWIR